MALASSIGQRIGAPLQTLNMTEVQLAPSGRSVLTPEERVIFLLARLNPDEGAVAEAKALLAGGADWPRIVDAATRMWVHPLVARSVLSRPEIEEMAPRAALDRLALSRMAARVRWKVYAHQANGLFAEWRRRSIPFVVLKGAALLAAVYPPEARLLNDLDVWVGPGRLEDATAALLSAGFHLFSVAGEGAAANRRTLHGWVFTLDVGPGQNPLVVDLHERLHTPAVPYALDPRRVHTCLTTADECDERFTVLGREAQVVHLATQIGVDGRIKLQTVADLAALVDPNVPYAEQTGVDLDLVQSIARDARAEAVTALALQWASAAGACIDPGVVRRLLQREPHLQGVTSLLFDVRAVLPGWSLPAGATRTLEAEFADGTGPTLVRRLLEIGRRRRRSGAGLFSALWSIARSVVPMAVTWCVLRWGYGDQIANALWRPRPE